MLLFSLLHRYKNKMAVMGLFVWLLTGNACRKNNYGDNQPTVLQIVNALDDGIRLYPNFSTTRPDRFATALEIDNKWVNVVRLNQSPQPIQFYSRQDTMPENLPLFNSSIDVIPGETYSLFLHGEKSGAAYTLVHDQFPLINRLDTVTYMRFANFSESQVISVNLKGEAPGSFIQKLPFKSVTEFIPVKRNASMPDPEIEIRDQATGELLATEVLTEFNQPPVPEAMRNYFFRYNTFVLTGKKGGVAPNDQQIVIMQHR